jgi:hypothetical protein
MPVFQVPSGVPSKTPQAVCLIDIIACSQELYQPAFFHMSWQKGLCRELKSSYPSLTISPSVCPVPQA